MSIKKKTRNVQTGARLSEEQRKGRQKPANKTVTECEQPKMRLYGNTHLEETLDSMQMIGKRCGFGKRNWGITWTHPRHNREMFSAKEKPRAEGQTEKHQPKHLTAVLGETKNREEGDSHQENGCIFQKWMMWVLRMKELVKASPRYSSANKTLKTNQQENTKGKAVRAIAGI